MTKDAFANVTDLLVVPVAKTTQLFVGHLEKLVAFQFGAMQSYADFGIHQLKSAANINNAQDVQNFFKDQLELAASMRQKMMDDAKAFADISTGFKDDYAKLATENLAEFKDKADKVKKAA